MPDIVLAALNARWIHASFGLRCLRANLGALRERSAIVELEATARPADVAERILALEPRIVGIGVYVWNATPARQLVDILKRVAPNVTVVVGGPEVSHEVEQQEICARADHVVRGEADLAFAALCHGLLAGEPQPHVISASPPDLTSMALPYDEYTDQDLAHRIVYVEASRGCPFTCEFCLSALDDGVRRFPLEPFLAAMQRLLDRGLLHFKFVDRTFNLHLPTVRAILRFFRERLRPGLFLHFELIPDRLPEALRGEIAEFPAGVLQFEVGIQTFDSTVAARISRRHDPAAIEANLRWLRGSTGVHLHTDLIVGLPGEDAATFARGFDRLWALRPQEIQVGILKRLRGAPIQRHDREHGMVWSQEPPYELLANEVLSFAEMQRLKRFARYWDIVANSGRWVATVELLLDASSPFAAFEALAADLFAWTRASHGIALHRLATLLFRHLGERPGVGRDRAGQAMAADWRRTARHDWPDFLREWMEPGDRARRERAESRRDARQARHRGFDAVPNALG
jgi:hypothetical protein